MTALVAMPPPGEDPQDRARRAREALEAFTDPNWVQMDDARGPDPMQNGSQPCGDIHRQARVDWGHRAELIAKRDAQARGYTVWTEGIEHRYPPEALHVLRRAGRPMGGADTGYSDSQRLVLADVKSARPRKGAPELPGMANYTISCSAVFSLTTHARLVPGAEFYFEFIDLRNPTATPFLIKPGQVQDRARRNGNYWIISATRCWSADTVLGPRLEDPDEAFLTAEDYPKAA